MSNIKDFAPQAPIAGGSEYPEGWKEHDGSKNTKEIKDAKDTKDPEPQVTEETKAPAPKDPKTTQ